ncbi:MAG: peptidase S8, partial [Acidobacteriota bacterium]|nr:peptidase S8 [Acidobacteriota bacterium]
MKTKPFLAAATVCVLCLILVPVSGSSEGPPASGLVVWSDTAGYTLSLDGAEPFHRTSNEVVDDRLIDVAGSAARLALWSEVQPGGGTVPFYAISLDGSSVAAVRQTSYVVELRHGRFDPLTGVPPVDASLRAAEATDLYLVQFATQPLEEFRTTITELGGTVHKFMANHTHYVRMSPAVRESVEALPYVRWVGPVHPAYKLEEEIREQIVGELDVDPRRYSIMLHERGAEAQDRVVKRIQALGGEIHGTTPRGFRIEATLSLDQVHEIASLGDVMFIDRKGALEYDMDIVREIGGANHVESVAGFTGQGVRAEVADSELDEDHPEWSAPP